MADSASWILAENPVAVAALRAAEPARSGQIFTRSEGLLRLFFELESSRGEILHSAVASSAASISLLGRILQSDPAGFPWLSEQCLDPEHPSGVRPGELERLLQLLDTIRLNEREERLISKAIDEFGNVIGAEAWTAELIQLLVAYEQAQLEIGRFDAVAILEKLSQTLSRHAAGEWDDCRLPAEILLYRPTHIFALEAAIFERLAEFSVVQAALPADVAKLLSGADLAAPSARYLAPLQRFISRLPPENVRAIKLDPRTPNRSALAASVLDGSEVLAGEAEAGTVGMELWQCSDLRDEIERTAAAIEHSITTDHTAAADYQIVCTNLEEYREGIEREFRTRGIPVAIAAMKPLGTTLPGNFFSVLSEWWQKPSLTTIQPLLLHPCFHAPLAAKDIEYFIAFAVAIKASDAATLREAAAVRGASETNGTADATEFFRELKRRGYGDEDTAWNEQAFQGFLRKAIRIALHDETAKETAGQIFPGLCLLHREFTRRQQLIACSALEAIDRIRRNFHALRVRTRDFSRKERSEFIDAFRQNAQASRLVQRALRGARRELQSAAAVELGGLGEPFFQALTLANGAVAGLGLAQPLELSGVLVTDITQALPLLRPAVIVLGCTARAFEPAGADEGVLQPDLASISQLLKRAAGNAMRSDERAFILARLLLESAELVMSVPQASIDRTQQPAWLCTECAVLGEGTMYAAPLPHFTEPSVRARLTSEAAPGQVRLIEARASAHATEYDGSVGAGALPLVKRYLQRKFAQEVYFASPSGLRILNDNPFQFFAQELLQLEPFDRTLADELPLKIGKIIHAALQKFFSPKRVGTSPAAREKFAESLATDFPKACADLLKIAGEQFERDDFDWQDHAYLRAVRDYLTLGLSSVHDTSQFTARGPLLAALIYQRDLLTTLPIAVEQYFGPKDGVMLTSEDGATSLGLSGVIDRLDSPYQVLVPAKLGPDWEPSQALSIWDYKTGKADTSTNAAKGDSLQVPLYAAAVRRLFKGNSLPISGGQLELSRPNRRDPDLSSPIRGAAVQHLAVRRKGNGAEAALGDASAVEAVVNQACAKALAIHQRALTGTFAFNGDEQEIERGYEALYPSDLILAKKKWAQATGSETSDAHSAGAADQAAAVPFTNDPSTSDSAAERSNQAQTALRYVQGNLPNVRKEQASSEQQAALSFEYPIALRAGAGSGKTFVLRTRVLEIIRRGGAVDSIVAITFTEAAAEEIRHRIEQGISAVLQANFFAGSELNAEERANFVRAKWDLHRAQIGTIHQLAARVTALDPLLAQTGGYDSILLENETAAETERAVRSVLSGVRVAAAKNQQSEVGAELRTLLQAGIKYHKIRQEVLRLTRNPRVLDQLCVVFDRDGAIDSGALVEVLRNQQAFAVAAAAQKLREFLPAWISELEQWLPGANPKKVTETHRAAYQAVLAQAKQSVGELVAPSNGDSWIAAFDAVFAEITANYQHWQRVSKDVPRNFFTEIKNVWVKLDDTRSVIALDLDLEASGWKSVAAICRIAVQARRRYDLQKRELRAHDFEDLLTIAHRMVCVRAPGALANRQRQLVSRLKSQFKHILVDEFQDTDPLQWEFIGTLAGFAEEYAVTADSGSFFMVGDLQQAIYSFRGGDVRVFAQAANAIERAGGKALALGGNYRSHADVLHVINRLFEQLLVVDTDDSAPSLERHFAQISVKFQHLDAKRGDATAAGTPRVFSLLREYSSKLSAELEAKAVAKFVESVLADIADPQSTRWQSLRTAARGPKIAILGRKAKHLARIADALAERKIPYSLLQSSRFYQLDEISPLVQLLRLLVYPQDSIALVAVLRSPLFALSDLQLLELLGDLNGQWTELWNEAGDRQPSALVAAVYPQLSRWHRLGQLVTPHQFLTRVIAEAGIEAAYAAAGLGEAFGNICRFIERIRVLEQSDAAYANPYAVVSWLALQTGDRADAPVQAPPSANDQSHAVQLMTIHKAKGLEFPMVILPYLDSSPLREHDFAIAELQTESADGFFSVMGIRLEDEEEGYERISSATLKLVNAAQTHGASLEEKRVFYVAASRAKEYLVLSMMKPKGSTEKTGTEKASVEDAPDANPEALRSAKPIDWLRVLLRPNSDGTGFETGNAYLPILAADSE